MPEINAEEAAGSHLGSQRGWTCAAGGIDQGFRQGSALSTYLLEARLSIWGSDGARSSCPLPYLRKEARDGSPRIRCRAAADGQQ
jgi:hypothetical protein